MAKSPSMLSLCLAFAVVAPAAVRAQAPTSEAATPPPVAYASVTELNTILTQVRQTAQNITANLEKTRIEKWKTDSGTKRDVQGNVESIRRNLQSALPEIITQLNNAPEDLAATFKLYRNLDALYDVFGPVVESAGAFGSKDEYQNLSNNLSALQSARRALGERMQNLTTAKENELTRLRSQLKTALAAVPPPPPKRTIVDDTQPPKKPAKKKAAKPKPAPATTTTNPPSSPQ
jgi:exonuclease VII large subunit